MKKHIKQTKRLFTILSLTISFVYQSYILIRGTSEENEKRRATLLREHIEKLGSVFVKFGQFLSIHPTYLSPIYCSELFYLLENVPPFPAKEVINTFTKEFHTEPQEMFGHFELQPFAAASFGQVHKATLPTGERVVVKVQRPHITATVDEDIALMKFLATMLDFFPLGPNKFMDAVREFETWTREELDYVTEASLTEEFARNSSKRRSDVFAPVVYKKYSSRKILTTEYIEGITFSKILLAIRNNDLSVLQQLKKLGFSREEVATKLTVDTLKQVYLNGFFHGDPHPANIIYTKKKKIALIDFGICGRLTKRERLLCLRYARTFWMQDFDNWFDTLLDLCDNPEIKNKAAMREEFMKLFRDAFSARERRKQTSNFRDKNEFQETFRLLQKYKVTIPTSIMLYFKTAIVLRNITFFLYPEQDSEIIVKQLKHVSLLSLASGLSTLFSREQRKAGFMKLLNIFEKELVNSLAN